MSFTIDVNKLEGIIGGMLQAADGKPIGYVATAAATILARIYIEEGPTEANETLEHQFVEDILTYAGLYTGPESKNLVH